MFIVIVLKRYLWKANQRKYKRGLSCFLPDFVTQREYISTSLFDGTSRHFFTIRCLYHDRVPIFNAKNGGRTPCFYFNNSNSLVRKQNTNIKLRSKNFSIPIYDARVIKILYAFLNYEIFSPVICFEIRTDKECHPATSLFHGFVKNDEITTIYIVIVS